MECQQDSISSLQQELESMFSQKEQELATQEKRLDELHTKKTSQLTLYIDDLKSDIGKLNVIKIMPFFNYGHCPGNIDHFIQLQVECL